MVAIALLFIAALGLSWPRISKIAFVLPLGAAGLVMALGEVTPQAAYQGLRPLLGPLSFVAFAVPLAVMLDRLGLFVVIARRVGTVRHHLGSLFLLVALVTALFNLDAAVVLLGPLYVRIAQQRGESALYIALQPALLSSLFSSALPISNLTNLIVQSRVDVGSLAFVEHLALPSVMATTAGYLVYRQQQARIERVGSPSRPPASSDLRAVTEPTRGQLVLGSSVAMLAAISFVVLPELSIPPTFAALGADLVLVIATRRFPIEVIPWRLVLAVAGLSVLAGALRHELSISSLLEVHSTFGLLRLSAISALGANLFNNLSVVLLALPFLSRHGTWGLWAMLLGTNVGPLLPFGSLAIGLWLETVRRAGLVIRERDVIQVFWRIALVGLIISSTTLAAERVISLA